MKLSLKHAKGFTLIEVLVSLSLMALIATILIASLQLAGNTWHRITRFAANAVEIQTAQEFLRSRLQSISPQANGSMSQAQPAALLSDGRTVEFRAPSGQFAPKGLVRYRLGRDDSSRADLTLSWALDSVDASAPNSQVWQSETLVHHIRDITFKFWRSATSNTRAGWVPVWPSNHDLPRLIQINVSFATDDTRRWPPLYVEPRVNAPPTCDFDLVSRRCRITP